MDTDPGESTDYVEYPGEKPFINSCSRTELRLKYGSQSPLPMAVPVTNSASIISALESLQNKIKELELNREKTLHDLESVSKRMPTEERGTSSTPPQSSPPQSPAPQSPASPPPLKESATSLHKLASAEMILDAGEKVSKSPTEELDLDDEERLPSNPSTPRNIKEANRRSSAIGKRLEFVAKEYGTLTSSLQNLRTMASSSRSVEKENVASGEMTTRKPFLGAKWSRRSVDDGCSTLMAMQNLEKERASLKISQSLAEARIRALEKELGSNRRESAADNQTLTEPVLDAGHSPDIDGNAYQRLHENDEAVETPATDYERRQEPVGPARDGALLGERCTCDYQRPIKGARKGRERLCQMQNRLNQRRVNSKSPLRRSPGGRSTPEKGVSRCHYRLNMRHVPFVVGKSVAASHSLTANIQTLVAKMKTHDSGICDHIRLLHEDADDASPSNVASSLPKAADENSPRNARDDDAAFVSNPSVVADQLKEVKAVLDALQDEFAAMSFEHHELTIKLKALGVDDLSDDVRSASQDAEIISLETELGDLVAKMNVKGKQIKVLKKILKGLKEKKSKSPSSSTKRTSSKAESPPKMPTCHRPKVKTRSRSGRTEVQLGKGQRVNVQDGIMVRCIPSTARGARDLLYGIKDLHRTLNEADICWQ